MELAEFMFELPPRLIAQRPSADRGGSRLMVVRRETGELIHARFVDLAEFLAPGDLLVLNDSRVIPARLRGRKESGGRVEVLLLEPFPGGRNLWIALVRAAKKPHVGSRLYFAPELEAEVLGSLGEGRYGIKFLTAEDFMEVLDRLGEPPLPPYIKRACEPDRLDRERYQTVYASSPGSVAAPTAGFHFGSGMLGDLAAKGIDHAFVTLHVGAGTFNPIRDAEVERHLIGGEWYALAAAAAEKIIRTKNTGRRLVAVGSTTTRVLEWVARRRGRIETDSGITRLFIHPGHRFRAADALITNFHLPGSTPLVLVAAFAGLELTRRAYAEAVERRYRFYSYGDAMLIL